MRLRSVRDDGTLAIPFKIEFIEDKSKISKQRWYYRVTFGYRYPVDVHHVKTYAEVIDRIKKEYLITYLNFDTVELC